jgi:hypothetical protein
LYGDSRYFSQTEDIRYDPDTKQIIHAKNSNSPWKTHAQGKGKFKVTAVFPSRLKFVVEVH